MKKIFLFILLGACNSLHSSLSLPQEIDAPTIDTSTHPLSVPTRAFVLRLVMLNCLINKDYEGLSHIIEKTKLYPGNYVIGLFETKPLVGWQVKTKEGALCYRLYKSACESKPIHKRTIGFLAEINTLVQISIYSNVTFHDDSVRSHVQKHPDFNKQKDAHELLILEEYNEAYIAQGRKPLTLEEHREHYERLTLEWHKEYLERTKYT